MPDKVVPTSQFPPISNPTLISSSNPSLHTLVASSPTKSESRVSQLSVNEEQAAIESNGAVNICTFSICAQSYDLAHSYQLSLPSMAHIGDQPPQLPDIPLSPPLSASLPPSPILSPPEPLYPRLPHSQPPLGRLLIPTYHRPFCARSIYPTTRPHPNTQYDIPTTAHRQASVDELV